MPNVFIVIFNTLLKIKKGRSSTICAALGPHHPRDGFSSIAIWPTVPTNGGHRRAAAGGARGQAAF